MFLVVELKKGFLNVEPKSFDTYNKEILKGTRSEHHFRVTRERVIIRFLTFPLITWIPCHERFQRGWRKISSSFLHSKLRILVKLEA